ncbi:MAG: NifB/NifX family molybdenum-iron cluster-binding protein [Bacteroidales bacterium]
MKTVITSKGDNTSSLFDTRFGRAEWFCLYDEETGDTSFVENESRETMHGAGTRAVEQIVELGAKKVISGDFGPRAKELLDQFKIQMVVLQGKGQTIGEIINKIK